MNRPVTRATGQVTRSRVGQGRGGEGEGEGSVDNWIHTCEFHVCIMFNLFKSASVHITLICIPSVNQSAANAAVRPVENQRSACNWLLFSRLTFYDVRQF